MNQLDLFVATSDASKRRRKRSGTFTDNMKLPVHRWFRYSAGFSAEWVQSLVADLPGDGTPKLLDPFCGSGTGVLAAALAGAEATGFEPHPFVSRIAQAKMNVDIDPLELEMLARTVLDAARVGPKPDMNQAPLLLKCYSEENLSALLALKNAYEELIQGRATPALDALIWLAITCILRECSDVGTAQWQYVLPNKTKARVTEPFAAFHSRIAMFTSDMAVLRNQRRGAARIIRTDARQPECTDLFDIVVTSPPYPNNYDYADATRLEMTFWQEIEKWGDLQDTVRKYLIRSCSQHSAAEKLTLFEFLERPEVASIRDELSLVCHALQEVRLTKGGRKTYHTMIAAYFCDLSQTWLALRKLVRPGGKVAFVIGDSAPYGVYVPCDRWLGQLALSAGFSSWRFEKLRDRNVKWKNRKHDVPLKEGILWVEG